MTKYKKEEVLTLLIAIFATILVLFLYFSNLYVNAIKEPLIIILLICLSIFKYLRYYIKERFDSYLFLMDACIDAVYAIVIIIQKSLIENQGFFLFYILIWGATKSFVIFFTSLSLNKDYLINKTFALLASFLLFANSIYLLSALLENLGLKSNYDLILNMFSLGLMPVTVILYINYISVKENKKEKIKK